MRNAVVGVRFYQIRIALLEDPPRLVKAHVLGVVYEARLKTWMCSEILRTFVECTNDVITTASRGAFQSRRQGNNFTPAS